MRTTEKVRSLLNSVHLPHWDVLRCTRLVSCEAVAGYASVSEPRMSRRRCEIKQVTEPVNPVDVPLVII